MHILRVALLLLLKKTTRPFQNVLLYFQSLLLRRPPESQWDILIHIYSGRITLTFIKEKFKKSRLMLLYLQLYLDFKVIAIYIRHCEKKLYNLFHFCRCEIDVFVGVAVVALELTIVLISCFCFSDLFQFGFGFFCLKGFNGYIDSFFFMLLCTSKKLIDLVVNLSMFFIRARIPISFATLYG